MAKQKKEDPRGGHVRLYWDLVDSMAWRCLSPTSKALYVAMRRDLKGTNNGNISATLGDLKHRGIRSSATLAKGLRELQSLGLIAMTRQGGVAWGKKTCSLYRFTDEESYDLPRLGITGSKTTHEWKTFTTLAQANNALKQAHANAKRSKPREVDGERQNKVGLQKVNGTRSKPERKGKIPGSVPEAVAVTLLQEMKPSNLH